MIRKVITVYLGWELMEILNKTTGLSEFHTDNWCNKSCFEENPSLYEFINDKEKELLNNNEIDFVVFRVDD